MTHAKMVAAKFDDWVPPPVCAVDLIVYPTDMAVLQRYNRGFDEDGKLCYRVISGLWWQYYHWRLRDGGWLHCRAKFSYDPHVKYAYTPDGEYKLKSVKWYVKASEALGM